MLLGGVRASLRVCLYSPRICASVYVTLMTLQSL
jgi:hypothetical protein